MDEQQEWKILTPAGILGYGFPAEHFQRGVDRSPDIMIVDAGSTDPGPYMLGLGKTIVDRKAYRHDLTLILRATAERKIPLIVSSAGGPGIDAHVDDMVALIRDIAAAEGWRYKIATIYADVPQSVVRDRLAAGRVTSCSSSPVLETKAVDDAVKIVAQMGAEPFIRVLQEHPDVDVIIAGRAYDPAPHAAFCAVHGIDPGVAWHAGKILECGAVCAEPKGRVILATMRRDSFELEPMNPAERCTPASVAAHTLAGNFALPLNPPENPIGPVCAFTVYHLMEVDDPCELFPIRVYEA